MCYYKTLKVDLAATKHHAEISKDIYNQQTQINKILHSVQNDVTILLGNLSKQRNCLEARFIDEIKFGLPYFRWLPDGKIRSWNSNWLFYNF